MEDTKPAVTPPQPHDDEPFNPEQAYVRTEKQNCGCTVRLFAATCRHSIHPDPRDEEIERLTDQSLAFQVADALRADNAGLRAALKSAGSAWTIEEARTIIRKALSDKEVADE